MGMRVSGVALAAAFSAFAVCAAPAPFAERDVLKVRGDWRMGREKALALSGKTVSDASFDASGWLKATVPGTVLNTLVENKVLPDPYWGVNNRRKLGLIPDLNDVGRDFYSAWFRAEFDIPADFAGKRVWMRPEGINYRSEIWLNGKLAAVTAGMFRRQAVDVTDFAKPGARNAIAVKVLPVDYPGDPRMKSWGAANGEWRNGGDGDIGRNVTMLMSVGWDFTFSDGIRDRNTGIWKDITFFATGKTRLDAPFVKTRFAGGRLDDVEVEAEVTVDNIAGRGNEGLAVGFEIDGTPVKAERRVSVRRGETQTVRFTAKLPGAKLWWPRNKGAQHLYTARFTARADAKDGKGAKDAVSDSVQVRFGVRESHSDRGGKDGARQFHVNGRKIFVRGTNWIPEAMLKSDDARMEAEVRLLAESGVNLVRLWGGGIAESDYFYQLCDEYGIMVWQEFWMTGDTLHPVDRELYLACVADTLKRIRCHASLCHYVCSNESTETPGVKELIEKLDGTHSYMMQSECDGVHDGSPYKIVNPMRYYEDTASDRGSRAYGFNPEYGTCALPDAEYLRTFMPEEMLWPIDVEAWKYREGGGFDDMTTIHDTMVNAYGKSSSIDGYCRRSEAVDAMNHRALWEMWNRASARRGATGVLFWYANTPVPKIGSHAWDHSLGLTSAFFAQKGALAPLHAQFDYLDNTVSVMNDTPVARRLEVVAEVYDFSSRKVAERSQAVDAPAETCTDVFVLDMPADLTPVHFVRLVLLEDGRGIDSTVYWRSTSRYTGPKNMDGPATAGFETMDSLPATRLEAAAATEDGKPAVVVVRNAGDAIAFLAKISVKDAAGRSVKPVFFTDNWFCLMPGESRLVEVEAPASAARWSVKAWNTPEAEISVRR